MKKKRRLYAKNAVFRADSKRIFLGFNPLRYTSL